MLTAPPWILNCATVRLLPAMFAPAIVAPPAFSARTTTPGAAFDALRSRRP